MWAAREVLARAAWEFAGVDELVCAAEALFGPYPWGRFDLLVMPPSFPYGGMENPRLAFVTPTLLAGDRSLQNVVAHELAHAWTGNLVTNASAEHFWLNEGFTVFAERRILEAVAGPRIAALHAAAGRRALDHALADLADRPGLTCLRTHLSGIDPDEAFSRVPYEKGYLFLRALEDLAGRARFDQFLRRYLDTHRFQSLTTGQFGAFLAAELPEAAALDVAAWLEAPGLVLPAAPAEVCGEPAPGWSALEWQRYLEDLPSPLSATIAQDLEQRFQLSNSPSCEVLVAWLTRAIEAGHAPALARTEALLAEIGRIKYLKSLYIALAKNPATRARAGALFRQHRARYHFLARSVLGKMLRQLQVPIEQVNPVSLSKRPL